MTYYVSIGTLNPAHSLTHLSKGGGMPSCKKQVSLLMTHRERALWELSFSDESTSPQLLTTSQPMYLQNLISLQTDSNTGSSDVVTLARPSPASSLKITDRSFQYASPHLWNQLSFSLREPVSPLYAYLNPSFSSRLSPSITPSLFHSKLKTYLFGKYFLPQISQHRHSGLTYSANETCAYRF